jgi:lipid-A-disaccharide synthase
MSDRAPTIFVSAGDTSGDQHAAALVAALRARRPTARFVGFGGPALRAAGVELIAPLAENPVMGFARVLPAIGRFVALLNECDRRFRDDPPDVVVPVDYPGFNVRLARLAKRRGVPVAYLVAPQYWGWAPWRAKRFARSVDLALAILPFEPDFLARFGVRALHVGHPLADRLANAPIPADDADALAVLPGSRRQEVEHLLAWQLRAAARLDDELAAASPAGAARRVRKLTTQPRADVRAAIAAVAQHEAVEVEVRDQPLPELLRECRAAVVTSGTATLECALMRVPSAVVYRVNRLSLAASRVLLTSPWIALPNLLAGHELFPEHLAASDPSAALGRDLAALWRDGPARERVVRELDLLRARMLVPGATEKAADAIVALTR